MDYDLIRMVNCGLWCGFTGSVVGVQPSPSLLMCMLTTSCAVSYTYV